MCGFYCVTKRDISKKGCPMTRCTTRLSAMSAITCFANTKRALPSHDNNSITFKFVIVVMKWNLQRMKCVVSIV